MDTVAHVCYVTILLSYNMKFHNYYQYYSIFDITASN